MNVTGEAKCLRHGAEAKARLKRAFQSVVFDPKPGDLAMSRLKVRLNLMEGRTHSR